MRIFKAFNREFEYYPELGERTVEIPLAFEVYGRVYPAKIIEVGYVLARQMVHRRLFPERKLHRVIDLFDLDPRCENIDAGLVDYTGAFVISISTLEHFDMADHGNLDTGRNRGVECLLKILKESAGYFITWPLGYNRAFDASVKELGVPVAMLRQVSGPTNETPDVLPEWVLLPKPDWSIQYSKPFHYGNGVAIISNVPCILNHEIIHRHV
jgi:hypothetical protein